MKIGIVSKPNSKGQFVIPKSIREKFGIDENSSLNIISRDSGFYIYPIERVESKRKTDNGLYLKILEKTQGTWAGGDWEKTEKKRRKIELKASRRRKKPW